MKMEPVDSEAISSIGYDEAAKELYVFFRNGSKVKYFEVSPEKHKALMDAESKGKHFAKHIRPAHKFARY